MPPTKDQSKYALGKLSALSFDRVIHTQNYWAPSLDDQAVVSTVYVLDVPFPERKEEAIYVVDASPHNYEITPGVQIAGGPTGVHVPEMLEQWRGEWKRPSNRPTANDSLGNQELTAYMGSNNPTFEFLEYPHGSITDVWDQKRELKGWMRLRPSTLNDVEVRELFDAPMISIRLTQNTPFFDFDNSNQVGISVADVDLRPVRSQLTDHTQISDQWPRELVELEEMLARFSELPENWDSYGGSSISPGAIGEAKRILTAAINLGLPTPWVAPGGDAGIGIQWDTDKVDLYIDIVPGEETTYVFEPKEVGLNEDDGVLTMENQAEVLNRLAESAT